MPANVIFGELVERGNTISRGFEFETMPPIIGKIVMTKLNEKELEKGWIETKSPTAFETEITKPVGRYYTLEELMDDSDLQAIIITNLNVQTTFNGYFK